jgi:hypothetical protein
MSSQNSLRTSRYRFALRALPGSLLALALKSALACNPSLAAAELAFRYGPFEQSISVANLKTYAETKKAAPDVQNFLGLIGSKRSKSFQGFLQTKLPISVVKVDKVLDTDIGKEILVEAAKITVRSDNAGAKALRGALVVGSSLPEGFGFISFLEAYPSPRLTIDVTQLPKFISFLSSNKSRLQSLGASLFF